MAHVVVLGCGPGVSGLVFSAVLFCYVSYSNDAGVLVGEAGQLAPANQTSTFGNSRGWAWPGD